ncbi:limonene-1,2-epoxide hydrolase [Nitrobacteraceae bacterium AZCC 1564]
MVKVTVNERCRNAPKKEFVRDFIIAIVKGDASAAANNATDDITWHIVGGRTVTGKQAVLAELQHSRGKEVQELIITTIVTHGYDGVADGLLKYRNGKSVAFCDIYSFRASTNNAPIKAIRSYTMPST